MAVETRHISVWFALCALIGCSTIPATPETTPLRPVALDTPLNVSVSVPRIETPDALDAGEAVGNGVGAGTVGGAGMGLASSLYLCGPFFFVCAPATVTAGALGGAVIGSASGAAIALPKVKASKLESIVSDYLSSEDIPANLLAQFEQQQAERWQIVVEPTDVSIALGIERLNFEQHANQHLALSLISNLVVRYGPGSNEVTKRILLHSKTGSHHIDYWIANDGVNVAMALEGIFVENTKQVVAVLSGALEGR